MTRCLTLLVLLTFPLFASAETFRMRNGSTVNGTIKQGGGGSVRIETADGVITYNLLEFNDATRARLIQYDKPLATPAPAPTRVIQPVAAQERPARPTVVEKEEVDESQTVTMTKLPRSRAAFEKQVSKLKGPAFLVFWGGVGLMLIGGLWFLVRGFQQSLFWGIALILCNPSSLVFLIMHWSQAKDPFFLQLAGLAMMLFALVVMS
jgi:hypothetical protein